MAEMIWNSTPAVPATFYENDYENNSKIVRLTEDPEIKRDIRFDELSLNLKEATPDNGGSQVNTVGAIYPIIRINDYIFGRTDIKSMRISSAGFIPTIELTLEFQSTRVISNDMPKDGDIVSIFVRTNTDAVNYLRNDFIIKNASSSVATKSPENVLRIFGTMFIPGIESKNSIYGVIGTSKDVMKETARRFKLGFAYNDPDNTNDLQNWLCCYESPVDFLTNVTKHSWKNSTSFFKSWIDFYYNLCFVNVNRFLSSEENPEEEIDITFNSNVVELNETVENESSVENAKPVLKVFTNALMYRNTPFYITKWKPINNSGLSIQKGYSNNFISFIHNQNLYNESKDKCAGFTEINSAFDETKMDSHILLRGRAKYDENLNPNKEQARINYDMTKIYQNRTWGGIEYKMDIDESPESNTGWSGNIHQLYSIAPYHNGINEDELNKLYIEITCDGLCLQVMRGERVPVYIQYSTPYDRNSVKDSASAEFNKFYSGYYVVDSIEYKYDGDKNDGYSAFSTVMILKRKEWPAPEEIQKDETAE